MADSQPINRKQRRAAARKGADKNHLDQSDMDFKLAQPDRSGPKAKTLFEIAAERQEEMRQAGIIPASDEPDIDDDDDSLGAFGDALVYSFTLSMLHFTLDVLVYNQYRQEIVFTEIFKRLRTAFPVLFITIYLLHTKTFMRFKLFRQLIFFAIAVACGCYMVYSGNTYGYFAIMKRAPPVGTLWVWAVIELELYYAFASLVAVLIYLFANGYGNF